ncbi:MAG: hypothetical protein PWP31_106 [Clostridia bacterium]|nr:hypothetical protein [Clostridia bacterium]
MESAQLFKKWRVAVAIILLAGALFFLYEVREILTPFFLAALIAYLLKPMMLELEKKKIKRSLAILYLYLLLLGIVSLLFFFILPQLLRELNKFIDKLPVFTTEIENLVHDFYKRYNQVVIPPGIRSLLDETIKNVSTTFQQLARNAVETMINLVTGIASFLLAPILAYYFLRDSEHIGRTASNLLPIQIKEDVLGIWKEIDEVFTNFIRGHVLVSIIVGFFSGVGLAIVGSSYAVILGVIVGLADLIPYFGPIIGAVPVVALSLLESKQLAIYSIIVMVIVQQIESFFLSPFIMSERVGLHPLMVVFAILAGGELWGVLGLLLGVPIIAIGRIIIKFIWARLVSS